MVSITQVSGTELHHKYPRQTRSQPVYVYLDCKREKLYADTSAEIGSGMPSDVWHNHTLRWRIPALRPEAANALLAQIEPLATQVVSGYEDCWDGHNHVGVYSKDAEAAREAIEALCENSFADESAQLNVWEAADWMASTGSCQHQCTDLGITAETTDEALDAIEAKLTKEAEDDDVTLDGLDAYLRTLRTLARASQLAAPNSL